MNSKEKGQTILLDLITKVEDIATPESLPIFEGNKYIVTLKPKRISNETLWKSGDVPNDRKRYINRNADRSKHGY